MFWYLALSAKVALGELLRLCPGSAGLSTSVEKAKTDCHDKAGDWSLFGEVFRVPKDVGERSNLKIFPTHTQDHGDA